MAAIVVTAALFGAGHLPMAARVAPTLTGPLVLLHIVLGNAAFGVVAGYLYWRYGPESAIIAHMTGSLLVGAV